MEAALTWLFGSVRCRVPDGRSSLFSFQPLLPTSGPGTRRLPPVGVQACPLPCARRRFPPRPLSTIVGYRVHDWADHSAFYVTNSRGQRLFVQVWRPDVAERGAKVEKGVVYVIHGLNDHSNKYAAVARAWVDAGFAVVAHDHHGHGRSDGMRGYTASVGNYVEDAADVIGRVDKSHLPARLTTLPKFLLAHSLGGAVAIHLARDRPHARLRGVMLTAPAVAVFPKPLLRLMAPILATLAPLQPVQRLGLRRRHRQQPQQRPQMLRDDPLVVKSGVRARTGYEVLKSCHVIMTQAHRFRLPVLVAHSADDRVTNAKGTVRFHQRIASHDKTVRLYEGTVHDLLAHRRRDVVDDMIAWASQRLH